MFIPLELQKSIELSYALKFVEAIGFGTSGRFFSSSDEGMDWLRDFAKVYSWDDISSLLAKMGEVLIEDAESRGMDVYVLTFTQSVWMVVPRSDVSVNQITPSPTLPWGGSGDFWNFSGSQNYQVSARVLVKMFDETIKKPVQYESEYKPQDIYTLSELLALGKVTISKLEPS